MKKKGMKSGIVIAILLLAVGFAAVTTTLYIIGTIRIVPDTADFVNNLIFNSVESSVAETTAVITADENGVEGKAIQITTHELKTIGETVVITYDVINNSQYDAEIGELSCTMSSDRDDDLAAEGKAIGDYITVTPGHVLSTTYNAGNPLLSKSTSVKDTLTITMVKSYAGTSTDNEAVSITLDCEMVANAVESTTSTTTTTTADAGA